MRVVVQRVSQAKVVVAKTEVGSIGQGLLLFVGVGKDDNEQDAVILADKVISLRIFSDSVGKMNLSAKQLSLPMLIISQFTLFADCSQGRRPYFGEAASPELGENIYEFFCTEVAKSGLQVEKGKFRNHMEVSLINDGPVTILLDSKNL